jgi:integrase
MQARLTADDVRTLTERIPPVRETMIFDTVLPRFFLRVRPSAAPGQPWPAMWGIRYIDPNGRERKMKVGSPATMNLDKARRAARDLLADVDRGKDPVAAKAQARAQWSVKQAADAYIASKEFQHRTPRGQVNDGAVIQLHIVHRLAHTPIASLDVPRVRRLLREVEADRRVNSRKRRLGGPGIARKVARVLSAMLSWCVDQGELSRNPLVGALRLTGDGEREAVITTSEQYVALFTAMDDLVAAGELRTHSRAFLTVSAATGLRRSEIQALRWGDTDLTNRRLTLRNSKGVKLQRKGRTTETVSLPPLAAAALAAIRLSDPEPEPDALVFEPYRGERYSVNRDWLLVRAKAGLPADLTLHGLRHSLGTVAAIGGMTGPQVQQLLRHRNISTTARYVHFADDMRLQDRALAHVVPVSAGGGDDQAANPVIPLAKRRT